MTGTTQIVWQGDIARPTGLAWLAGAECLLVCDPEGGRLGSLDPDGGAVSLMSTCGPTSFCFPTRDGELLLGMGGDLVRLDGNGNSEVEIRIDMPAHLQTGTGTTDRLGRLWFAAPDASGGGDGRVYRYHDGRMIPSLFGRCRPGGVAVSADGRMLVHANGTARRIEYYRISPAAALSAGEVLAVLPDDAGEPRGIALDRDGGLWVALSSGRLALIAPDGTIAMQVEIAGEAIDVAFGGADMATLFISTPGAIHAVQPPVAGLAIGAVKLSAGAHLGLIEDEDH